MDFLDSKIDKFVCDHTEPENSELYHLNRETHMNVLIPRMLSGHLQGRVLSMLSHMIKPKNILEIGTYTGYSAICLAEGLQEGGKLTTIDINDELEDIITKYIQKSGLENTIEFKIGNAIEIIPSLKPSFDLVFIDADKGNYSNYFDLVINNIPSGAYIIADNVLWSGKVIDDYQNLDVDTKAIVDFCKKVHDDDRVQNVLFPIRDGLMVLRKI